jgi:hypothetical protein
MRIRTTMIRITIRITMIRTTTMIRITMIIIMIIIGFTSPTTRAQFFFFFMKLRFVNQNTNN